MIKIISKKEYEELKKAVETLGVTIVNKDVVITAQKQEIDNLMLQVAELKKEAISLKSKITKTDNKLKKVEEEGEKHKKIVKETLKEVHKEHKRRKNAKDNK